MQADTYDAILFDFGGVFTQSPFAVARAFGEELGASPGRILDIVFGPYDADTDHPWHRLERGEIALEAARDDIIALGASEGLDTDLYRVLGAFARGGGIREPFLASVRRARAAGLRTAIVTNNIREFRDAWRKLLPVDELFDAVVDSSEVGRRKPDPAIFHRALTELGGVAPGRAVFLDDYEGNVRAARRLGMRGILVDPEPDTALAELLEIIAAHEA
jgi:putative hydrolase of the HAD superfamily